MFGLKDGKSNMMAPLLQSAPSEVLVVTCPSRSKCGLPNLMLMLRVKSRRQYWVALQGTAGPAYPLRYVEVITISFSFHWASNSSLTRFSILLASGTGNANSKV